MNNTSKKVGLAIAGSAMLLASASVAADGKNYAGSQCVRFSGGALSYNYSRIYNNTTTDSFVDCPAVKDASSISSGYVKVLDRSSAAVECGLNSLYVSGTGLYGWQSPIVASGGNSTTWQTLSFGSLGANSAGYYYYSCKIPAITGGNASAIAMYHVNEND